MSLKIHRFICIIICLFISSCATTTKYQGHPEENADNGAYFHFYRENSAFGSAITAPVYVDQYLIGRIGPGGKFITRVPVGSRYVTSTTSGIKIEAEENKHYYFLVSMPAQVWFYAPEFDIKRIRK